MVTDFSEIQEVIIFCDRVFRQVSGHQVDIII